MDWEDDEDDKKAKDKKAKDDVSLEISGTPIVVSVGVISCCMSSRAARWFAIRAKIGSVIWTFMVMVFPLWLRAFARVIRLPSANAEFVLCLLWLEAVVRRHHSAVSLSIAPLSA